MRSRTDSESVRTSRPSTRAEPPLSGKRPVSILMTVVFPLPLGPRKPKISPFRTRKLTSLTAVKLAKRRTRCSAEMATSPFVCGAVPTASIPRFQFHVGGHAGKDAAGGIMDADFYANDLMDALFARLHIARQEFGLLIDLFDDAIESSVRERIEANLGFLANPDEADLRFGNVDAYVDLIFFQKSGNRRIGSNEVARSDVENFHSGGGGSGDLALTESGLVVGIGCFGEFHVFAPVAAFEFFQAGLCLMVMRFGGGDLLGAVAALEFIQLMTGALLLGDGHSPVRLGGIALLLGDEVFFCQRFVAVEIQMRADFVSFRAVEFRLCGGDIFLAIAVSF